MKELKPIIVSIIIIVFSAFFLSKVIAGGSSPETLTIVVIAFVCLFISFVSPTAGIVILVFSMLLSPEIKVANVPGRVVSIRYDDVLLLSMALGVLARNAIVKEGPILTSTPLNMPIAVYTLIFILSTVKGVMMGNVNPVKGFFYSLKYVEYFILFFMIVNSINTEKQIKIFLIAALITAIIVTIYGYTQIGKGRIGAPFDLESPEPASLGGYLLVVFGILAGLLIYAKTIYGRLFFGSLIISIIPPFLQTFSRASYIGFVVMFLGLIAFAKRMKLTLLVLLIAGVLLYPLFLPTAVITRVSETFIGNQAYSLMVGSTGLEPSASERVESYKNIINEKLPKRFFFGYGVTGVGFLDSQYFLVLAEVGAVGLIVFIWLIARIFKSTNRVYRTLPPEHWAKGLTLGFLVSFAGILAQALTTNSFIIVRIMEPFWFLCAVIVSLPKILPQNVEQGK